MILLLLSLSTLMAFLIRSTFDSCSNGSINNVGNFIREGQEEEKGGTHHQVNHNDEAPTPNPLDFMKSKLVLLVSHELSLSGGPLLLMELAFLLREVGADVVWVTNQKQTESDDIIYSLEHKMIKMPETYVVHLGNSKELMEVAENRVAKRVLREHVRESLGVKNEDLVFALINSVSRGKGQDLFLRSFHESLKLIQERKLKVPPIHAVIVGSDMNAQTKFETELRNFVSQNNMQGRVHFVNKTLTVTPYLASIDVLVQNSQARGECFGRITIEAMAFQLPVLGTAAGGTMEIVVNGTTGLLHPAGKEGVMPLSNNIVKLATNVEKRLTMGKRGYERVKERFLEHHMSERIAKVLKEILLHKAKRH
ncbi:hypothetical protein Gotri_027666 [Gossypium trilobum]|uniref:Glycosyl transferase family 1 domain-containing protein n=1 Tax=Gossypium trilobum TaxID=34281 RepID=A0A7J9FSE7_9ROSI|nr:hypothetical protein [Gossypium trilobum]